MIGLGSRLSALVGVVGIALGGSAGDAAAGSYQVKSCFAGGQFSPGAFVFGPRDVTRGMGLGRTCDAESHVRIKGIVTGEAGSGLRPRGSRAIMRLSAPAGTKIAAITWRGNATRTDCGWEMAVLAVDGRRPVSTVEGVPAGRYRNGQVCDRKPRLEVISSHHLRREVFPQGATTIVQRIVCRGYYSRFCSAQGANYIRTLSSRVTIRDDTPPAMQITGGSLFGGWVSGRRDVKFAASDAVGVQSARVLNESGRSLGASDARPCDFSKTVPCPNGPGALEVDTAVVSREGTQIVVLSGYDAAGNTGSAHAVARIDNTPPPRVDLTVDGGDGWHRANAFTARWQNPAEPDRAPIAAAHFRICRADGKQCSNESRRSRSGISDLSGLSVPGPGEWRLSMWREDEAGNVEEDNASVPARLLYDPDPPAIAFQQISSSDPTRLGVDVREDVSGLAGGQVEMSRAGSGSWRDLPTQSGRDELVARVDDSKLPPGNYLVRARAVDRAGNQAFTDRKADGSPMMLTLPLRVRSAMRAGFPRRRVIRRAVRRHGRRRIVHRRVARLVRSRTVGLGRVVRLAGRLGGARGHSLVHQTVYVGAWGEGQAERLAGIVTTDARGRYTYLTRAARNTIFRFVYLGTGLVLPAQAVATLRVPARTSLRVNRRGLRNGQRARFRGKLLGSPIPPSGKLVELQVLLTGHWQTFRTLRTDSRGRWAMSYMFRRTTGAQSYKFRAHVPREAGYPFEPGRSRPLTVRVTGRR